MFLTLPKILYGVYHVCRSVHSRSGHYTVKNKKSIKNFEIEK